MPRRPDDAERFAYADAGRLVAETLDTFLPPSSISVAEHATQHRWVKASSGNRLVRYTHETAPYLRGPMESLTAHGVETVAVVGPAATGKTAGPAESWLLQTMHADPADMLWYMQTEDAIEKYVKARIEPMLDAHDKLLGSLREGRDSIGMKRFRGGRVEFLPFTDSALVNKHVQRIIADELDAYDPAVGDPETLLNFRRQSAGSDSMLLAISHPDLGGPIDTPPERQRGIMRLYAKSDRRTWWWGCPHCGAHSSPNPGTNRRMIIQYPEDAPLDVIEAEARLLCPTSGCLIEDGQRHGMNMTGRWLCAGEEMDEDGRITGHPIRSRIAGYWIVGAMSPFVMGGIGALARQRVEAERTVATGGDVADLRRVMVKAWGEPVGVTQNIGPIDKVALAERARANPVPMGVVPEGARFITAWADAQGNRWEALWRAWGEGAESWIIHREVIPGDPAASAADWDALLTRLQENTFPLADGSGRHMKVRAAGFDSQGQPGVAEQAYAAWLRRKRAGKVHRLGKLEGKDAWSLVPTKGGGRATPRIVVTYPNSQRKDRKALANGDVPILLFNPNSAKDALAAQLSIDPPRPGSVHLPAALLTPGGPPHAFLDQLTAEQRNRITGAWHGPAGVRNEGTDMMVGCEVVARLHGLHRIRWDAPPPWAAPWDANSMIVAPDDAPTTPMPVAPPLHAPPAPVHLARPVAQIPARIPARVMPRRRSNPSSYMS
ncbi:terminase gpA endonuclease subunit [Roseomonas sp. F4]